MLNQLAAQQQQAQFRRQSNERMAQYQQAAQEQNMQRQAQFQQQRDVRMAGLQRQQADQNYQKQLALEDYRFGTDGTQSQFQKSRGIQNLESNRALLQDRFALSDNSKLRMFAQERLQNGFIYTPEQETKRVKFQGNIAREEDLFADGTTTFAERNQRIGQIQWRLDGMNPLGRKPETPEQYKQRILGRITLDTRTDISYIEQPDGKLDRQMAPKDDSQFKIQEQQYERTQAERKSQLDYDNRQTAYGITKQKAFEAQRWTKGPRGENVPGLDWERYSQDYDNHVGRPLPPTAINTGTSSSFKSSGQLPTGDAAPAPAAAPTAAAEPLQDPVQLPQATEPQQSASRSSTQTQQAFRKIASPEENATLDVILQADLNQPQQVMQKTDFVINGKNLLQSPSPVVKESAQTYYSLINAFAGRPVPQEFHGEIQDALLIMTLGYSKFPITDADVRVIPAGIDYFKDDSVRRRPGKRKSTPDYLTGMEGGVSGPFVTGGGNVSVF